MTLKVGSSEKKKVAVRWVPVGSLVILDYKVLSISNTKALVLVTSSWKGHKPFVSSSCVSLIPKVIQLMEVPAPGPKYLLLEKYNHLVP